MKRILCAVLCVAFLCGCAARRGRVSEVAEVAFDTAALSLSAQEEFRVHDYRDGVLLLSICEWDDSGLEPPYYDRFVLYDTADASVRILPVKRKTYVGDAILYADGVLYERRRGGGGNGHVYYLTAEGEEPVCTVQGLMFSLQRCDDAALFVYARENDPALFGVTRIDPVNGKLHVRPLLTLDPRIEGILDDAVTVHGRAFVYPVRQRKQTVFYGGTLDGKRWELALPDEGTLHSYALLNDALLVSYERRTEDGYIHYTLERYDFDGNLRETVALEHPLENMHANDAGVLYAVPHADLTASIALYATNGTLRKLDLPPEADTVETEQDWHPCFVDGDTFLLLFGREMSSEEGAGRIWRITAR